MKLNLDLQTKEQEFKYDCGVAVLQTLLIQRDSSVDYKKLLKLCNAKEEKGVSPKEIVRTLCDFDMSFSYGACSIKDIKKDSIAILPIQSKKTCRFWKDEWKQGHYILVVGKKKNSIIYFDPADNKFKTISSKELIKRWHDIDYKGTKYVNFAIFIW